MNAVTTTTITPATPGSSAVAELRPGYCLLGALVATVIAVGSLVVAAADPSPVEIVRPVLVALWAAAGVLLGLRRQRDRLAPIVIAGSIVASVGTLAAAMLAHRSPEGAAESLWALAERLSAALLPAVALHLLLGLADGRLATAVRRNTVIAGYTAGTAIGLVLLADREHVVMWPLVLSWLTAVSVGVAAAHRRYVEAGAVDRRRMQWLGWGMAVAAEAVSSSSPCAC